MDITPLEELLPSWLAMPTPWSCPAPVTQLKMLLGASAAWAAVEPTSQRQGLFSKSKVLDLFGLHGGEKCQRDKKQTRQIFQRLVWMRSSQGENSQWFFVCLMCFSFSS